MYIKFRQIHAYVCVYIYVYVYINIRYKEAKQSVPSISYQKVK